MTQLEMSLELASYRAKLQEAADTKEKLADLKTKLQREQMTRQNSRRGKCIKHSLKTRQYQNKQCMLTHVRNNYAELNRQGGNIHVFLLPGSYSVPRWVRDLELSSRKSEKRRCSRIRDPEKLSFREKLEIFLQPQ